MDSLDYAEGHATAQRGEQRNCFRSVDYQQGYTDAASLPRHAAEATSAVDKAWDDIDAVMADPATSDWLKQALRTGLLRCTQ